MYTGWPPLPLLGSPTGVTSVGALGSFQSTGTLIAETAAMMVTRGRNCIAMSRGLVASIKRKRETLFFYSWSSVNRLRHGSTECARLKIPSRRRLWIVNCAFWVSKISGFLSIGLLATKKMLFRFSRNSEVRVLFSYSTKLSF